jgi:hypothetical protein
MDKSGAETMPTTTEPPPAPSAFPRENVRRGRNRDHKRRHVRRVEHGETSLPRRGESAAWPTRRPTPEREQGLALRPRGGLPAPWGAAAADPNALAITSEAAASGRRPGAAAVRPRRASRCRARDARNHAAPGFCARRPFRNGNRSARVPSGRVSWRVQLARCRHRCRDLLRARPHGGRLGTRHTAARALVSSELRLAVAHR